MIYLTSEVAVRYLRALLAAILTILLSYKEIEAFIASAQREAFFILRHFFIEFLKISKSLLSPKGGKFSLFFYPLQILSTE